MTVESQECSYCNEARHVAPQLFGCLKHFPWVDGIAPTRIFDTRLQAIADADLAPVAALVSELCDLIESKPVAFNSFQWASRFRNRVLALAALTKEDSNEQP